MLVEEPTASLDTLLSGNFQAMEGIFEDIDTLSNYVTTVVDKVLDILAESYDQAEFRRGLAQLGRIEAKVARFVHRCNIDQTYSSDRIVLDQSRGILYDVQSGIRRIESLMRSIMNETNNAY